MIFVNSSFFVVTVILWSNRVVIRINMHRKATKSPHGPLGRGERQKNIFFISLIVLKKIFLLNTLLNSNSKTSRVNIDLN
jgi:hypothetical protein